MTATEVWYASPDVQDNRDAIRFGRVAVGAQEALVMLRDAEQIITERTSRPRVAASKLVIFIDGPAKLFADQTHGLLLQARAQSLTRRASRENGVRIEIEW